MTQLRKAVHRETRVMIRDAGKWLPLVVSLEPAGLVMRQKGRRHRMRLPYEVAWRTAALLVAEERRRERKRAA